MTNLFDIWQDKHPGDYAAGVRLLQSAGWGGLTRSIQSDLLSAMLTGQWTSYIKGKVEAGLKKCKGGAVDAFAADSAPRFSPATATLTPPQTPPTMETGADERKLTSPLAVKLHKEHSHLHALMVAAKNDRERGRLAKEIMEKILPALDREYDRLRAGASPDADTITNSDETPRTPVEMIKRQNSLRARTSRLRNHLIPNAPSLARKQELQAELEAKETELNNLTALLANVTE